MPSQCKNADTVYAHGCAHVQHERGAFRSDGKGRAGVQLD